jgi:hypothetical protein
MLCNGKSELGEAFNRMALRTIGLLSVLYKLSLMIIRMTVCATVMLERISGFALMALLAPYGLMHPFKSEVCFVVVKTACPPFY